MPIHDVKKTDKITYLNKTFFNVIGSGLGIFKFVGKPSQAKVGPLWTTHFGHVQRNLVHHSCTDR